MLHFGLIAAFSFGTVAVPCQADAKIQLGKWLKKRLKKKKKAVRTVLKKLFKKTKKGSVIVLDKGKEVMLTVGGALDKAAKTEKQKIPGVLKKYKNYLSGKAGKEPPKKVNHKLQETGVRNQGRRGTCAAFATVAGMERLYKNPRLNLSEQDAWYAIKGPPGSDEGYCDGGAFIFDVAEALKKTAIAPENKWRYQSTVKQANCDKWSESRPRKAKKAARYKIKSFEKVYRGQALESDEGAFINNPKHVEAILASGYDVVIDVGVAGTGWSSKNARKIIDVELDENSEPLEPVGQDGSHQYHALLIVGYNRSKEYFIVKNSWGMTYAKLGYVHLSYDYIRTYSRYGVYITDVSKSNRIVAPKTLLRGKLR
jgi:hypothetical protein